MRQVEIVEHVSIEYNEYVPLTVMWRTAGEVLEAPVCVVWRDENGYLELKFDPSTGILIEVVLAAAPGLIVEQMSLSPISSEDASLMPFLNSSDIIPETASPLVIKAYLDYLYVSFGPGADRWAGSGPVLFGLAGEQNLAAFCARWTGSERESVLAGQSGQNAPSQ